MKQTNHLSFVGNNMNISIVSPLGYISNVSYSIGYIESRIEEHKAEEIKRIEKEAEILLGDWALCDNGEVFQVKSVGSNGRLFNATHTEYHITRCKKIKPIKVELWGVT